MSLDLQQLKNVIDKTSISRVANQYILSDNPICFKGNKDLIFKLNGLISKYFKLHPKNIEIVGSAKLGFSLNEYRLGEPYNKNSDIDFALVSSSLYDEAWHELLQLEFKYYQLGPKEKELLRDCYKDIPHGFISPDKLPLDGDFSKNWWKFFSSLSNKPEFEYRKIRGRLFKNWWFAEKYYSIQLTRLSKDNK